MKKAYQIDERKAMLRFRSYLNENPKSIQLVLPLAGLAQRLRHGVSQMLFEAERDLLLLIMNEEIQWLSRLSQEHGMQPWGTAPGSVIIHGQKVPVQRTRVRGQAKEAKLGSYELFRLDDEMQRRSLEGLNLGVSRASRWSAPSLTRRAQLFLSLEGVNPGVSRASRWSAPSLTRQARLSSSIPCRASNHTKLCAMTTQPASRAKNCPQNCPNIGFHPRASRMMVLGTCCRRR